MRGTHGAPHHAPRVGMQATRDIERQHRAALGVHIVDEARVLALYVAREANAEQAVDDETPGFVFRYDRVGEGDANTSILQEPRDDPGIATVVAGSGDNEDVFLLVRGEAGSQIGGGGAG